MSAMAFSASGVTVAFIFMNLSSWLRHRDYARRAKRCIEANGAAGEQATYPSRSAEVSRQQPGRYRLATVALVADVGAGETLEDRREAFRHVAVNARGPDVVDHPVLRDH